MVRIEHLASYYGDVELDGDVDGEIEGDALGDSEGEVLAPPPVPPVPPPLSQAARAPPTKLSTKARLKIFFFITPLTPIAARMMSRSLIKIPHLLTFLKRHNHARLILS